MARKTQSKSGSPRLSRRRDSVGSHTYSSFQGPSYYLLGIVLGVILLGFIALAYESLTLAPLLMVSGYCLGIPVVIIWRRNFSRTGSARYRKSREA